MKEGTPENDKPEGRFSRKKKNKTFFQIFKRTLEPIPASERDSEKSSILSFEVYFHRGRLTRQEGRELDLPR